MYWTIRRNLKLTVSVSILVGRRFLRIFRLCLCRDTELISVTVLYLWKYLKNSVNYKKINLRNRRIIVKVVLGSLVGNFRAHDRWLRAKTVSQRRIAMKAGVGWVLSGLSLRLSPRWATWPTARRARWRRGEKLLIQLSETPRDEKHSKVYLCSIWLSPHVRGVPVSP